MSSLNLHVFAGNLARDPILGKTAGGTVKAFYTVAVDNSSIDKDGNKKASCDFFPVTTYGRQAENDAKYLKQGASVVITARVHSWWKPEEKKGGISFEVEKVQYMGRPSANGDTAQTPSDALPPPEVDQWGRDFEAAYEAEKQAANAITPPRHAR